MCAAYDEASDRMAAAGLQWISNGGEAKTLEEAMLAVEPGASGALYGMAMAKVHRPCRGSR